MFLLGAWLAQLEARATSDLGVVSSSPTLCVEMTKSLIKKQFFLGERKKGKRVPAGNDEVCNLREEKGKTPRRKAQECPLSIPGRGPPLPCAAPRPHLSTC